MTCLALLSIEGDTSLHPIATVYSVDEAAVATQDYRVKLRAGRLVALLTLTGESEEIASRMYDDAMDSLFAHPWSEPLETTEHGRAFIAAREPRTKKTTVLDSDVSLVEAARLATEPNRVEVVKMTDLYPTAMAAMRGALGQAKTARRVADVVTRLRGQVKS